MPKTIMGLETRACINGLNKTDFENVKQIPILESETDEIKNTTIPALDDRITALEQGGGSSANNWKTINYATQTSQYFSSPFFDMSTRKFKKDVIIKYSKFVLNEEYSGGYVYIPKDTNIDSVIFNVDFSTRTTSNNTIVYRTGIKIFDGNFLYSLFQLGDDDNRVSFYLIQTTHDQTNNTVTNSFSTSYAFKSNLPITIYYNDI